MEYFLFVEPGSLAASLVVAVFGLMVGSFLNVVIHRLPVMMQRESDNYVDQESGKEPRHTQRYNLVVPRSCCPKCGHQITAIENIPVISYLALRGKCRGCGTPISKRYPLVELLAAGLAGGLAWHFGTGWNGLAAIVFGLMLLAMTFIDLDTQLLPDDLTYPLLWLGLLLNINGTFVPIKDAVIGAAAGYLALWSVYWLFKLATGKEGMGYGDFKLLAALGAWMGWMVLPSIILLSSVVGALVGIGMIVFARHQRGTPIPFGPYLAIAGLVAMVQGPKLVQLTSGLLG